MIDPQTIQATEYKLFEKWLEQIKASWTELAEIESTSPHVIRDGLVEPREYRGVVFVFKDANWEQASKDANAESFVDGLLEGLRAGGCNITKTGRKAIWRKWQVVSRWIHSATEGESNWDTVYERSRTLEGRGELLRRAGIINVKKTGGKDASDPTQLRQHLQHFGELVYNQVKLYKPKLVVTGGLYDQSREYIFKKDKQLGTIQTHHGNKWYRLNEWECSVIEYPHFGYRTFEHILHYGLTETIEHVLSR